MTPQAHRSMEARAQELVDKIPADCDPNYEVTTVQLIVDALRAERAAEREACAKACEALACNPHRCSHEECLGHRNSAYACRARAGGEG